jgi:chaperone modulatory protein CbpM
MMTLEGLLGQVAGVEATDVTRWVALRFVRPEGEAGAWVFGEMDVARVRLIVELRDVMEVDEPALPAVLGLLDQLYDLRRRIRRVNEAMEAVLTAEMRAALARHILG